jgi:hypothetical protein
MDLGVETMRLFSSPWLGGSECGVVEVAEHTLGRIGQIWDSSVMVGGDGNCMSGMGNLAINLDGSASDMAATGCIRSRFSPPAGLAPS